jgi:SAM-dependent methyltransferase
VKLSHCLFCGPAAHQILFRQEGRDPYLELVEDQIEGMERCWNVCLECGFVFRSPVLGEAISEVLYSRYERNVFKNTTPDAYFDKIINLPAVESENFQKTNWLKQALIRSDPSRDVSTFRILDVGCGGGTLLHSFRDELGAGAINGVELNPAYASLARRRLKAEIRNEPYKPNLFGHKFDLIVSAKVLEHVTDPFYMVSSMTQDLAPDGFIFIEVPDIVDIDNLPPSHERFWIPHVWYFSRATLGALVAGSGLSVIEARSLVSKRGRGYLQMLMQKKNTVSLPSKPFDDPLKLIDRVNASSNGSRNQ